MPYLQPEKKIWLCRTGSLATSLFEWLNNNDPAFLHLAFCNPYFGPFFQGHKPTHVFKIIMIVRADWLGESVSKWVSFHVHIFLDKMKQKMPLCMNFAWWTLRPASTTGGCWRLRILQRGDERRRIQLWPEFPILVQKIIGTFSFFISNVMVQISKTND